MTKHLLRLSAVALLSTLIHSCSEETDLSDLPHSSGSAGDILLMMDSSQWKGPLGQAIEDVFQGEEVGLPREEPHFNLHYIQPAKFNRILRTNRNLIFALTLDGNTSGSRTVRRFLTKESIDQIRQDTSLYVYTTSNVYAQGQEVMYLLGRTEDELIHKIRANREKLVDYLNLRERERLSDKLFTGGTLKGLTGILKEDCHCTFRVPFAYKLVMSTEDFVWLRRIDTETDRSIFVSWKAYRDTSQFSRDSLVAFRNTIARKHLFEDPEMPDSYLVTETSIPFRPVLTRRITFNGEFGVEMRGLWRTNHATMGGPFLGYATTDPASGRLYYAEGFLYSPGKKQREMMREIETVLWTLRFTDSPTPANP